MFAALAIAATAPTPAPAQTWPERPLTMVVPFAPGGAVDVMGRILAARLGEVLGQRIIVENVGGAGGMSGASRVAKATPDGYEFVLGSVGTHAQSQSLYKKPLYNAVTDFAPVALVAELPLILVARKDLPANNLREFIAYARKNQADMQFGSAGAGSADHLTCLLIDTAIESPLGQIAMVPTAQEQGLAGFEAYTWDAIFLPKGTPDAIVRKLNAATIETLNTPIVRQRLAEIGANIVAPERRSSDYLGKFVASEIEKWAGPIKASGVAID